MRAPFQVLVFPYLLTDDGGIKYAVFRRSDMDNAWQGIAGGGEDDETPLQAAQREAHEEAGIPPESDYVHLESQATIPVPHISGFIWGDGMLVIPEYSFGVEVETTSLRLTSEHREHCWLDYAAAYARLTWDSNKNALWELNWRLTHQTDSPELP